jgi:hypothetical protein
MPATSHEPSGFSPGGFVSQRDLWVLTVEELTVEEIGDVRRRIQRKNGIDETPESDRDSGVIPAAQTHGLVWGNRNGTP